MSIDVLHGDCLEIMATLPESSIDACIADPPYGTTTCKWDAVIPFAPMWTQLLRVCKPNAAIVLHAAQPFSSALVMSKPNLFRYALVWDKVNKYTGFLNAAKMPMKRHEDILVFYRSQPTYNPQKEPCAPYKSRRSRTKNSNTQGTNAVDYGRLVTERNPCSVLTFEGNSTVKGFHETQKPVDLVRYLIRTYSNEGETVLDFAAGSGTTGLACQLENRHCVLIENDASHVGLIHQRISSAALPA